LYTIFEKAGRQVADDLGLVEEADEEEEEEKEEEYYRVKPLLSHSSGDRLRLLFAHRAT
jgi:hypothetical protein